MAYPIYQGMDLKFQITTEFDDFHLTEDNFQISVKNRWGQVVKTISKDDCFYDSDGRFYFTIEGVERGTFHAFFQGSFEDDDYDKQQAVVTDEQQLFSVPSCPECECGEKDACSCECCHKVHYKIVTIVSIDGADYLADCDGRYIYTSDDKRIQFTNQTSKDVEDMAKIKMKMTGEEFLRKWEEFDPNSEVDTIPELFHSMQGITDNKTVKDEIEDEAGMTYEGDTRTLYINGAKPKPKDEE